MKVLTQVKPSPAEKKARSNRTTAHKSRFPDSDELHSNWDASIDEMTKNGETPSIAFHQFKMDAPATTTIGSVVEQVHSLLERYGADFLSMAMARWNGTKEFHLALPYACPAPLIHSSKKQFTKLDTPSFATVQPVKVMVRSIGFALCTVTAQGGKLGGAERDREMEKEGWTPWLDFAGKSTKRRPRNTASKPSKSKSKTASKPRKTASK